ncbi:MAG: hypothetical protein WCD76_20435 [Pyrinomonadaceae bacterium]
MNYFQRWKKTTITNQALVITGVLVAFSSLVYTSATIFQIIMWNRSAEQTTQQTDKLIAASERIASASATAAEDARKSNAETANRIDRMTRANEELANAAAKQANSSETSARAAEIQANTSQVTARAIGQNTRIAQDTFRLVERPSLGVEGVALRPLVPGEEAIVRVTFRNSGHTPATHFTIQSYLSFQQASDINVPCPTIELTELSGLLSRSTVPINGTAHAVAQSFIKLNDEFVKAINSGKMWLYVYVIVRYEGSGQRYFSEFYARFDPEDEGSFIICGEHNNSN